jgi:catechol-2,3-dioxygenase
MTPDADTRGADTPAGPLTGLSHVQLRVADASASAEWYSAALGLEPFRSDPAAGYVALRHRPSGVVIVLTATPDIAGPDVGPLDQLALAVADASALEAWAEHLTAIGIDHPGVVPESGNPSLQLRDPDGTAVELVAPGPRRG